MREERREQEGERGAAEGEKKKEDAQGTVRRVKRRGREERRVRKREKAREGRKIKEDRATERERERETEREGSKKRDEKEERGRLFGVRDLPLCVVCRRHRRCCVAVK